MKNMKTKYKWKPGLRGPVEPEIAGQELDRIQEMNDGILTPEAVVEFSKDADTPLHKYFEWNDKKASAKFRTHQARMLINHIECVVEYKGGSPIVVNAFTSMVTTGGRGYFRTDVLLEHRDGRDIVLKRAFAELQGWKNKYTHLREFASIFKAIEKVRKAVAS